MILIIIKIFRLHIYIFFLYINLINDYCLIFLKYQRSDHHRQKTASSPNKKGTGIIISPAQR